MTDNPEKPKPHVLTVDGGRHWSTDLHKRLRAREIEYTYAEDADAAVALLNSGDYSAVITDGLKGQWRKVVEAADGLELRSILLSNSTMAVNEAQTQGVMAFHTSRSITRGGMDTIIQAATRPKINPSEQAKL